MPLAWEIVTGISCVVGTLFIVVSAFIFANLVGAVVPLLQETKDQIQDLGDLATNTLGRASETMELIENRVSGAMTQATEAGDTVKRQSYGLGMAMVGLYLASRFSSLLRHKPVRRHRRR